MWLKVCRLTGPPNATPGISAQVNEYADKVLNNVKVLMVRLGLDPMPIPNIHKGFSKRIIFITYTGSIDLTKGWLTDVSTISRHEDVIVSFIPSTKKLTLEIPLSFDELQFSYKYSAKFMHLGPVGGIEGKVRNLKIHATITIDMKSYKASLDTFKIVNAGFINIKFTGHILIDWFVNLLTDTVSLILHNMVLNIVSNTIHSGLNEAVDDINKLIQIILNPASFKTESLVNTMLPSIYMS